MSKRKRKPIDPQGHNERPGLVPAFIRCNNPGCAETRMKDRDWRGPCAAPKVADGQKAAGK